MEVDRHVRSPGCVQIGIGLFSGYGAKRLGPAVERLVADYPHSTTLARRLEATTEVDGGAEQRALDVGFVPQVGLRGKGLVRGQ